MVWAHELGLWRTSSEWGWLNPHGGFYMVLLSHWSRGTHNSQLGCRTAGPCENLSYPPVSSNMAGWRKIPSVNGGVDGKINDLFGGLFIVTQMAVARQHHQLRSDVMILPTWAWLKMKNSRKIRSILDHSPWFFKNDRGMGLYQSILILNMTGIGSKQPSSPVSGGDRTITCSWRQHSLRASLRLREELNNSLNGIWRR